MPMEMNYKEQRHHSGGGGGVGGGSLSSSSDLNHSSSSNSNSNSISLSHSQSHQRRQHQQNDDDDPMQSWWESVSKARSRIRTLISLLPPDSTSDDDSLSSLADSDRPAQALLGSHSAYTAVSSSLTGAGDDPLCHWLYDTFQEDDSDLKLVVISMVPLLSGLYLNRVHSSSTTTPSPGSPSLAGFEAVLLALYSSQTKSRAGKPLLVSIPTPAHLAHHPSLYHHPPPPPPPTSTSPSSAIGFGVGVLCPPLEPQVGIKSTKRATIIGVAFHCFYSHISLMPSWSKLELCHFAASCADNLDLPWELFQPMLRILAHCLLAPPPLVSDIIIDSASDAITRLYTRASRDLSPQAILATRSLLQLHTRARASAFTDPDASTVTTPTSIKMPPEMLLLSN
ncbi:hypothetical protein RND81_08G089900 [Saponaria officinalis]|uniref:Hyccin n=1 Tax=Saponaria officinalis TaxID=3572 RepID=A0AAW1J647_SAPOF